MVVTVFKIVYDKWISELLREHFYEKVAMPISKFYGTVINSGALFSSSFVRSVEMRLDKTEHFRLFSIIFWNSFQTIESMKLSDPVEDVRPILVF